jgi:DNA repair protein NreA
MSFKQVKYRDIEQFPTYFKLTKTIKQDFFGSSPAPFIGRYGYPTINVGLLAPQETTQLAWLHDAPRHWAQNDFSMNNVLDLRMSLINSRAKSHIKKKPKIMQLAQEVGLAAKPVDIEINLKKAPTVKPLNDYTITPMGPTAQLKKARITENPKINHRVQKVYYDTDLKTAQALKYLYRHKIDENALTRMLSVGSFGVGKNRKLVPTRWSITATDDTLGKQLIENIKRYNHADYQAFFGSYFGNYFLVLLIPDCWSYELFEMYASDNFLNKSKEIKFTTDHENVYGRRQYAHNTAGGYYAARLPILEKLTKVKRQATVIALRFITSEYNTPLGVWVVREAVRKAMTSKPIRFASKELMLQYAISFALKKFGMHIAPLLRQSKLINMKQKKLVEW